MTSSPARCSPLICSVGAGSASSCGASELPAGGDTGLVSVRIPHQLLGAGRRRPLAGQPDAFCSSSSSVAEAARAIRIKSRQSESQNTHTLTETCHTPHSLQHIQNEAMLNLWT